MSTILLLRVSGVVFALVAIGQLVRVVFRWEASVAGSSVPIWASVVAIVLAGYLAYESFRNRSGHYVCTGGCAGVSSAPGVCQAQTCAKKGMPLTKCSA
jgi:hypothetical protein